jgi:EAL domain-containing protein (putative c-di-GMP-specific phosphodiesterase class I)
MANTEHTVAHLQTLQDLGVQITIDDFGTGFSSLAYISQFPINKLKLDTSFVRNMTSNDEDAAIALAIIRMAHSLEVEVVAEGVETVAQLADLQQKGCDQIQGHYVSTPLPVGELEPMLREWRGLVRTTRATPTEHHHEKTRPQGKAFSIFDQLA